MRLALVLLCVAPFASAQDGQPELLGELRERGVIARDANGWTAEDLTTLDRIQRDEPDALELLGKRFGDERALMRHGFLRGPARHRRLTKDGDESYRRFLSQDAVHFFESKGIPIREMFTVKDAADRPLFDADGKLTDAGLAVYRPAAAGRPAQWKGSDGRLSGIAPPAR